MLQTKQMPVKWQEILRVQKR